MEAIRDSRGLVVHDDNGAVYAATSDEDEAGIFVGEEKPWLERQGLRRVGPWIAHNRNLGRSWPYDVPATHSTCTVEWIDPADPRRTTSPNTNTTREQQA